MNTKTLSIAIVVSEFNTDITSELERGCYQTLRDKGVPAAHIRVIKVPGAIEIPLALQKLAKTKRYQALIALGAVIRGETTHYDYVCEQVSQGCQKIMLEHEIPVIFGILTTENDEQAVARIGGQHGHKGVDAAEAALTMIDILASIE